MNKSIRSGWLVPGPYARQFEKKLSQHFKKKSYITSSCTAALHMALLLAGVKEGDEVITTPLTWVSTVNAIKYCGATPVFVDVEPDTGLIDVEKIQVTPKTKAIIVVHLYGQLVDIEKLKSTIGKVPIIQDAAHALETVKADTFATCLSFHAAKNITSGQGGALITNARGVEKLRRHGVVNKNGKRVMESFGYKYELTDFQAALLLSQWKRHKKIIAARRKVFERYLKGFQFRSMIDYPRGKNEACHMFVIWVNDRDEVRKRLEKAGIETSIHYEPVHLEPYYGNKKYQYNVSEILGNMSLTLPTYPMSKKQQDYIIKKVYEAVEW